jgi:hypothetical protein
LHVFDRDVLACPVVEAGMDFLSSHNLTFLCGYVIGSRLDRV